MTQKKIVEIALVDNSKKGYESHVKLVLDNGEEHYMLGQIENGKAEVLQDLEDGCFNYIFDMPFFAADQEEKDEWAANHPDAEVIYKAA